MVLYFFYNKRFKGFEDSGDPLFKNILITIMFYMFKLKDEV